jgi:hypothetical protein
MNLLDRILGPTSAVYSILRWLGMNPLPAAVIVGGAILAVVYYLRKN